MIEDLMQGELIVGKTKNEIDQLLGIPHGRDSVRNNRYIYWVGSSGIDDTWLEIRFVNGHAADVRYVPD